MREISLKGIKLWAFHGVTENEEKIGSEYEVDITLGYNWSGAGATDDLCGTVNYAEVYEIVKKEMGERSMLIENVAQRIVDAVRNKFSGITEIDLSVAKLCPPVGGEVERAVVRVKEKY